MTEMPLLVFTLIEQTTVGAFATLAVMLLIGKVKAGKEIFATSVVIAVLAVIGMLVSMAHLGQPLRALNVLAGVGTSPLSHEIVFFGAFVVFIIIYAVLAKFEKTLAAKVVATTGAVLGLVAVAFTSICYMMPGVPAWDSALTPAQFFLTVAACGIPLFFALNATFGSASPRATRTQLIWWGAFVVLLASQIVMRWLFFSDIVVLVATM